MWLYAASHWTNFNKVWYLSLSFCKICRENSSFLKIRQELRNTLHKDFFTFMIISRRILLRMRNVLDQVCKENQDMFYFQQLFPENRENYEKTSKNTVQRERKRAIWRMQLACCIIKATRAKARASASTHTHTHAHTHRHTHTRAHTQTHAPQTHAHTQTQTHAHASTHTDTHARPTDARTHTDTDTRARKHTHRHTHTDTQK